MCFDFGFRAYSDFIFRISNFHVPCFNIPIRLSFAPTGFLTFLSRTVVLLGLASLPTTAGAVQTIEWSFANGNVPISLHFSDDRAVRQVPEGVLVQSAGTFSLYITSPFANPVDTIDMTTIAPRPVNAQFVWHQRGTPEGTFVIMPFVIAASPTPATITLDPQLFRQWDPQSDVIGIMLPEGGEYILSSIRLRRWSVVEKAQTLWKSFWTFDEFTRYSINFLWGPLLTMSPVNQAALFATLPPMARSVNTPLFVLFGILGGVIVAMHFAYPEQKRRAIVGFCTLFAMVWVLYDLRMGMEIMTYAKRDLQQYTFAERNEKSFRGTLDFFRIIQEAAPMLKGKKRFGYMSDSTYMLDATATYFTYPAVPVLPNEPHDDIDTWLVFRAPGGGIDTKHRLVAPDGTVLTGPGKIVHQFSPESFLFSTAP